MYMRYMDQNKWASLYVCVHSPNTHMLTTLKKIPENKKTWQYFWSWNNCLKKLGFSVYYHFPELSYGCRYSLLVFCLFSMHKFLPSTVSKWPHVSQRGKAWWTTYPHVFWWIMTIILPWCFLTTYLWKKPANTNQQIEKERKNIRNLKFVEFWPTVCCRHPGHQELSSFCCDSPHIGVD